METGLVVSLANPGQQQDRCDFADGSASTDPSANGSDQFGEALPHSRQSTSQTASQRSPIALRHCNC
jgi:hypothetical protein